VRLGEIFCLEREAAALQRGLALQDAGLSARNFVFGNAPHILCAGAPTRESNEQENDYE
jgi:hypothetical protein